MSATDCAAHSPQQPSLLPAPALFKILVLGDAPVWSPEYGRTGFGRVLANVLGRWFLRTPDIDCVGIGFEGWGYEQVPYQLIPGGRDWNSPRRLTEFLQRIHEGDYTHAFILNDVDALSVHGFPQKLRQVCKAKGVRTMLYYPVDAPVEREWLGIVEAVDVAVAYTEYGREETRKALQKSLYPIEVVPHGVDDCFKPLSVEDRAKARIIELELAPGRVSAPTPANRTTVNFVEDDTFLIVNVNKNEWRKDPLRSLEILKGLRELGVPAKLLLRMDAGSAMAGIDLDNAAQQLGLTYGKEYCHIGAVPDNAMAALYNAADLYLTTSLGEGWGLGVTEAMACHCPVAMPRHTSLAEIGEASGRVDANGADNGPIWLPSEVGFVGLGPMRLRRRVNLPGALQAICKAYGLRCGHGVRWAPSRGSAPAAGYLKSWDWVAERLWGLLVGNN